MPLGTLIVSILAVIGTVFLIIRAFKRQRSN